MSVHRVICLSRLRNSFLNQNYSRFAHHLGSVKYAQTLLNLPETKVSTLQNGFKVATQRNESVTSTIGVWIDAGSRYETKEQSGVANFFEHLAFKGNLNKPDQDLHRRIQNMGAQLDAYTDREETAFYARCLPRDIPGVIDILGGMLKNVDFTEEDVDNERKVIQRELGELQSDLRHVTFDYLHLTAYQGTPLEKSVFGPSENIENITIGDIAFYHRNNVIMAPRMVLSAVGDVNHDELVLLAEKTFSSLPFSYTSEIPVIRQCRFTGSDVRSRDDWLPFAHVAIAIDTCGFESPDIYPLMLAKTFVGSWDKSFASNSNTLNTLVQHIYKAKGCHSYEAFHVLYRDSGLWGCYFVLDRMLLDDFLYNLQDEWMKLCVNVSEADLVIAKNMLRSNLLLSRENSFNCCSELARQALHFGEGKPLYEVVEQIEAVTLLEFREVCSKYIYDRCPAISAVGPIEALPDYTRIRANMYWLRY